MVPDLTLDALAECQRHYQHVCQRENINLCVVERSVAQTVSKREQCVFVVVTWRIRILFHDCLGVSSRHGGNHHVRAPLCHRAHSRCGAGALRDLLPGAEPGTRMTSRGLVGTEGGEEAVSSLWHPVRHVDATPLRAERRRLRGTQLRPAVGRFFGSSCSWCGSHRARVSVARAVSIFPWFFMTIGCSQFAIDTTPWVDDRV